MRFEWDEQKNQSNILKNGVDFIDCKEMFFNGALRQYIDDRKNYGEVRYTAYGYVNNRLMNVVFTERKLNIIRIISFRKANHREVVRYEKIKNRLG